MRKRLRVFISYAHRDGSELAAWLLRELESLGFDVWLDRERLRGGDRWTNEIESALDRSDVVLALLSEGSFTSDTCRAEQGWALDSGKRVIPLRVQKNSRLPIRLYNRQYLEFSDPSAYKSSFQELLRSFGAHQRPSAPTAIPEPHYNNAPGLPDPFVERPELLTRLRDALFLEGPQRNIGLTALQGMGGIGKTVLAEALCDDRAVKCA
jgi:hypothetical protein